MGTGFRWAWVALVAGGCATAPTTLQTARTTEQGEFRFHAGASVPISSRFISEVSEAVDRATERAEEAEMAGRPLTPEEERELLQGALGLILFAPAPVFELGARWGPVEKLDVGFEWAGPMLRFDAKYQFLERPGVDVAALAGYTYHTGSAPSILEDIHDIFDFALIIDYGRHDVDVAVLASGPRDPALTWYAGLRYMASFVSWSVEVGFEPDTNRIGSNEVMHLIAGTGGMRIGTDKVQLMLELLLGYILFEPEVEGAPMDLGGILFMPAIGLAFETG